MMTQVVAEKRGLDLSKALRVIRFTEPARAEPGDSGGGEKTTSTRDVLWIETELRSTLRPVPETSGVARLMPATVTGTLAEETPSMETSRGPPTAGHGDAGEKFEELTHVAVGHEAEFGGGDDRDQVGREALFVDGDGRSVHLARRSDDQRLEFDDTVRGLARWGSEPEVPLEPQPLADRGKCAERCGWPCVRGRPAA